MTGALVTERRLGPLRTARCWVPHTPDEVEPLLSTYDVVTVSHTPDAVGERFAHLAFSDRPDLTTVVNLRLPLEALHARLHKSCAYKIRRAGRLQHGLFVNERTDEARALLVDGIRRKRWRPAITDAEWEGMGASADVFLATLDGLPAAARVVFRAGARRALMQMSATAESAGGLDGTELGCVNRRLHWFEFEHYRSLGFEEYDFGGIVLDPAHRMYGIAQFKRSFGGDLVVERFLRLARNPLLRAVLRRAVRGDAHSPSMNAAAALLAAEATSGRTARERLDRPAVPAAGSGTILER